MNPGRELDAIVAEKIFKIEVCRNEKGGWSEGPADYYDSYGEMILSNPLKEYSTEIAAAWEVVDQLKTINPEFWFSISRNPPMQGDGWYVENGPDRETIAEGETAPHAICLAALAALEKSK